MFAAKAAPTVLISFKAMKIKLNGLKGPLILSILTGLFIVGLKTFSLAAEIELYLYDPDYLSTDSQRICNTVCSNANGLSKGESENGLKPAAAHEASGGKHRLNGVYCYEGCAGEGYKEAVKWFKKAAAQGYAGAQFNLGLMYKFGCGVKQDFSEALKWFAKSAELGDYRAQFNLGLMYQRGYGVEVDFTVAKKLYLKAAKQGHMHAQSNLGVMYYHGLGVKQDYIEAVKWFHKAADQGYAGAQYNLGLMCKYGHGVRKDIVKAHMWLCLSESTGNKVATNEITQIEEKMTTAQILESKDLLRKWISGKHPTD